MKLAREVLCLFLAWLMVNSSGPPSLLAQSNSGKDNRRAEEVKAAIRKLGTGKDARIMVGLRDRGSVRGYVHQTEEDGFSVSNFCSGIAIPVPFAQVRGLRGVNVATGTKVSAGKGVSEKAAAGLAAADPCSATFVRPRDWRAGRTRTVVLVCAIAVLVTIVVVIGVTITNRNF